MGTRSDFSPNVVRQLERRAGSICCFPDCECLTVGPSDEGANKTSSTGMACHIYAAANGKNAKRVNTQMTESELSNISNGIWMCYMHGKLIDTDEVRFTPEILQEWKRIGEDITRIRATNKSDYKIAYAALKNRNLIENTISLPKEFDINQRVGDAISDSYVSLSWGKDITDAIRDFIIEYLRNVFDHGKGTGAMINIKSDMIEIINDGDDFNPRTLAENSILTTGGAYSINHLLKSYESEVLISVVRNGDKNTLIISVPKSRDSIIKAIPCCVEINQLGLIKENATIKIQASCKEIIVFLPDFFAYSDLRKIPNKFPELENETRKIIFVVNERFISLGVQKVLKDSYPKSQVLVMRCK